MPMTNHPPTLTITLLVAALLVGCATQEPQPSHEWLAPDSFVRADHLDRRIDGLAHSFQSWCAFQEGRSQAQMASLGVMQEMLSNMQSDLRRTNAGNSASARECPPAGNARFENKEVLGSSEWVGLPSIGSYFKARLDTGANVSSLSATEIVPFERDGENWVRFRLALNDEDAVVPAVRDKEFEAKVVRHVRIIQASGSERRPVISLPMTLGPIEQTVEFTLNDRSHLSFPVLLGRRFMMDIAVIDIGQSYLHPRPEFPGGDPSASARRDQIDQDD